MFPSLYDFYLCVWGPSLYRIYNLPFGESIGQPYVQNLAEYCGDFAISYLLPVGLASCIWQLWQWNLHFLAYFGIFIVASYLLRGAGRAFNPQYMPFIQVLSRAKESLNTENLENLRIYDFEFTHWPVSFKSQILAQVLTNPVDQPGLLSTIEWLVGWVVVHPIGIRIIYPGLVKPPPQLDESRAKCVIRQHGQRTRVEAADENKLDTMFFDRRSGGNTNGNTLVISFEGNAGYYETGAIWGIPFQKGYSSLAYNHPGFAGSTGTPYPPAELNAAEAIFDFAVNHLGFEQENIILFGWSIGGFPASYLASKHPVIKALFLDATFDDILPLALPRTPVFLQGYVEITIRNHLDIRLNKLLQTYSGPLRFIRRTEDEFMGYPPGILANNRLNFLLSDTIRSRYPGLLSDDPQEPNSADDALNEWLAVPHDSDTAFARESKADIPKDLGKMFDISEANLVVSIAENLMTDFESGHSTSLDPNLFRMPWIDPNLATKYKFNRWRRSISQ